MSPSNKPKAGTTITYIYKDPADPSLPTVSFHWVYELDGKWHRINDTGYNKGITGRTGQTWYPPDHGNMHPAVDDFGKVGVWGYDNSYAYLYAAPTRSVTIPKGKTEKSIGGKVGKIKSIDDVPEDWGLYVEKGKEFPGQVFFLDPNADCEIDDSFVSAYESPELAKSINSAFTGPKMFFKGFQKEIKDKGLLTPTGALDFENHKVEIVNTYMETVKLKKEKTKSLSDDNGTFCFGAGMTFDSSSKMIIPERKTESSGGEGGGGGGGP